MVLSIIAGAAGLDIGRTKGEYRDVLTGIAKLASESITIQAKREVEYFEMQSRSILNRTSAKMPFAWTVNPYRGCEFGCKYCYARNTHEFLEQDPADFEDKIYAKAGAAALLARDLRKVKPGEWIAIGTATDPYQPAERKFGRTRSLLEVLARGRGRRISVTTKGNLVARDAELFRAITAAGNFIHVNMTVTTMDTRLARLMEPRAPRPDLRLEAVGRLRDAGIPVGVFASPVLPLINDSEASLEAVAAAAKAVGAGCFGARVLHLKPASRAVFFEFLEANYPRLVRRYHERFDRAIYLDGAYPEAIRERVHAIRQRHSLAAGFAHVEEEPEPTLFPLR